MLDPATGVVTKAAEGLKWPYRMLFTPDGRQVIVPDPTLNELRFIDRAARREIGRALPGAPQGVTITPDGRHVFQSLSAETRVAIIDPVLARSWGTWRLARRPTASRTPRASSRRARRSAEARRAGRDTSVRKASRTSAGRVATRSGCADLGAAPRAMPCASIAGSPPASESNSRTGSD